MDRAGWRLLLMPQAEGPRWIIQAAVPRPPVLHASAIWASCMAVWPAGSSPCSAASCAAPATGRPPWAGRKLAWLASPLVSAALMAAGPQVVCWPGAGQGIATAGPHWRRRCRRGRAGLRPRFSWRPWRCLSLVRRSGRRAVAGGSTSAPLTYVLGAGLWPPAIDLRFVHGCASQSEGRLSAVIRLGMKAPCEKGAPRNGTPLKIAAARGGRGRRPAVSHARRDTSRPARRS